MGLRVPTPPDALGAHLSLQARGAHLSVHFKNTREAAKSIAGRTAADAKQFLEDVIAHKRCVIFRRYNGGVGRTTQAKNEGSTSGQGRWPEKSAKILLGLLENAVANAEVRLDPDVLLIQFIL